VHNRRVTEGGGGWRVEVEAGGGGWWWRWRVWRWRVVEVAALLSVTIVSHCGRNVNRAEIRFNRMLMYADEDGVTSLD